MFRATLCSLLLVFASFIVSPLYAKDTYPSKPIEMIVPWPLGNATDTVARMVADRLSKELNVSMWVNNKPGANNAVGMMALANSAPDGYTIAFTSIGPMCIAPVINPDLPFDAKNGFAPIARISIGPDFVALVNNETPISNVQELVKASHLEAQGLSYASAGYGTLQHITGELFKSASGANLVHIPFKGAADAARATLAGDVPILFEVISVALPNIKSGKLRPLAVTSPERSPLLPDVPTFVEAGYPSVVAGGFTGLLGPADMPMELRQRISAALGRVMNTPEMRAWISKQGSVVATTSPEDFAAYLQQEQSQWEEKLREAGIKPQN